MNNFPFATLAQNRISLSRLKTELRNVNVSIIFFTLNRVHPRTTIPTDRMFIPAVLIIFGRIPDRNVSLRVKEVYYINTKTIPNIRSASEKNCQFLSPLSQSWTRTVCIAAISDVRNAELCQKNYPGALQSENLSCVVSNVPRFVMCSHTWDICNRNATSDDLGILDETHLFRVRKRAATG